MDKRTQRQQAIQQDWTLNPRWTGIKRPYTAEEVVRLQGSKTYPSQFAVDQSKKLWRMLLEEDYVHTLGALTGMQALQQVKAGLKAIYLSGWQVAADANLAGDMYPDQSLYPADSVPSVVRKINNAFARADQTLWSEGGEQDFYAPIVADAEAGFGGVLFLTNGNWGWGDPSESIFRIRYYY